MAKIMNKTGEVKSEIMALREYFKIEGQGTKEFMDDCKGLSPSDKTELAIGAAREMGWTVEPNAPAAP